MTMTLDVTVLLAGRFVARSEETGISEEAGIEEEAGIGEEAGIKEEAGIEEEVGIAEEEEGSEDELDHVEARGEYDSSESSAMVSARPPLTPFNNNRMNPNDDFIMGIKICEMTAYPKEHHLIREIRDRTSWLGQ